MSQNLCNLLRFSRSCGMWGNNHSVALEIKGSCSVILHYFGIPKGWPATNRLLLWRITATCPLKLWHFLRFILIGIYNALEDITQTHTLILCYLGNSKYSKRSTRENSDLSASLCLSAVFAWYSIQRIIRSPDSLGPGPRLMVKEGTKGHI